MPCLRHLLLSLWGNRRRGFWTTPANWWLESNQRLSVPETDVLTTAKYSSPTALTFLFFKGKAIVEKTKTKRSNHQILSYDDELIHEERLFYGTYPIRIKNMRCYIRHECIMASLAIMPCKLPACHRTYPRPVMRPMAGISPCHYTSFRHLMTLSAKEFTSTAIAYIILKGGMLQAQGDFWNNPTGVIRNRNPAPFRFMRRSNPSLRQSPPISFNLSKNAWLLCYKYICLFSYLQAFSLCKPCNMAAFPLCHFLDRKDRTPHRNLFA